MGAGNSSHTGFWSGAVPTGVWPEDPCQTGLLREELSIVWAASPWGGHGGFGSLSDF